MSKVTSTLLNGAVAKLNRLTGGKYRLTHRADHTGRRRWYTLRVRIDDNVSGYIDEGYSADVLAEIERRIQEARNE